jgi:signal transduction histidine kinase
MPTRSDVSGSANFGRKILESLKATGGAAPFAAEGDIAPRAVRMLRLLLLGTIVVPLVLAAIGGYLSYRGSIERAETVLAEAVAVAEENTLKVLDTHQLVVARINDLLDDLSDDQIHAREQTLHDKLAQQISHQPQVAAAWAIDASGHELVSARVYPVNRALDQSQREDFRALRNSSTSLYIWALRARSLDSDTYQAYFTVARRREGPNGEFRGISLAAVSGNYLASFYRSLLQKPADSAAAILRDDGAILAQYPAADGAVPARHEAALAAAIAGKLAEGMIAADWSLGAGGRLIAYKRVADYPVYVAITRSQASILHEWLGSMAGYLAVGAPAALGLVLLCLVALQRTRQEQAALANARDVAAERAAVERQLHQAQKMEALGQLSAGVAHDFNNLLTVIVGNIAMLKLRLGERGDGCEEFVAAAMSGCERASRLTRRLLSFSRDEPLDPQPTDVSAVVEGMADILSRSLGSRIACEIIPSPARWLAFVDKNQLENSLLNLALNARDAMAGQGRLTIRLSTLTLAEEEASGDWSGAGEFVEIDVADTGCGMPPEIRDKAFEPFFTTKEDGKGTGLGLSQVAGFAKRSGGRCAIDSTPGRGTTVTLCLPRYIEDTAVGGAASAPAQDQFAAG